MNMCVQSWRASWKEKLFWVLNFNCQISCPLKGQCHEISTSGILMKSVSSILNPITLGPLNIFRKFAEIFAAQGAQSVSLIPVVHLDLRISPQMLEKIERILMLFSGAWGKEIHEKTWSIKSVDCPFNYKRKELFKYKTGRRKHKTFNVMQRKTENGWRSVLCMVESIVKKRFRLDRKQNKIYNYEKVTFGKLSRITSWQNV